MNLAAIVLAAGAGSRFGGNKLMAPFKGEPLINYALRAALAAPVSRVIVVSTPHCDLDPMPETETVHLESPCLSASLNAGIASVRQCDGVFIFLGDMPLIPHQIAHDLLACLGDKAAAIPRYNAQHGHPVLLMARLFPAIAKLTGDEGAGRLLRSGADVAYLDCDAPGVLLDVDRVEDITVLERRA